MKTIKLCLVLAVISVCAFGMQSAPGSSADNIVLTRGEFVAMISDYFQWVHWSEYNDYAKAVPRHFSDVGLTHRYVKQIENALEENIISPDEDDRFHPDQLITRQDAAAILALAFKIAQPSTDALSQFTDNGSVDPAARDGLNALVAAGYMSGAVANEIRPAAAIERAEAAELLNQITSAQVSPVQVMPKPGTTSNRRFVNMTCPTPGATIHYTIASDGTAPVDPTPSDRIYDPAEGFLLIDNPMNSTTDTRYWTLKAIAVKDGMATSPVQTFVYYIYRPQTAPFEARLVHAPTATSPAVWDITNPSDYFRPHVYYIEGSERGVVMDAGQYSASKGNLKSFIDGLATKPYDVVLGHNHPDHNEQIWNFVAGGVKLYMTPQDMEAVAVSSRPDFVAAAAAAAIIRDGDVLDLGNVQMTAYQAPGHENGLVVLQDKKDGWIFGSDMFGCNRSATADITNYSGVKMDLFLSMVQQLYTNLRKDGGRIVEVYNAHNELPVGYAGLKNFEAAVQQLIDEGDSASVPSMRGRHQRTSVVGDMWRDKNWIAIWVGGTWGGPVDYLTSANPDYQCSNTIDYNAADGIEKYSVLSNIEIANGELAGVDLTWAPPSNGVSNILSNKFDPWTYAYDVRVPAANQSITVAPTAMSNRVTSLRLDGEVVSSGDPKTVAAEDGAQIKIDVVAPDGVTSSNYVLTVRKY